MKAPHPALAEQYANMQACIRCGLCLSTCPTYQVSRREEQGPRGRIAMAKAWTEGHVELSDALVEHQLSCLLCDACTTICPAGVKMEPIGIAMRRAISEARPPSRRLKQGLALLTKPKLLAAASRLARLYQKSGLRTASKSLGITRLLGAANADDLMPDFPSKQFRPRDQTWRPQGGHARYRVALFSGCIMSTAFAGVHEATARVLAAAGCEVVAPAGQSCCGALHAHSGLIVEASSQAERNAAVFGPAGYDAVIVNSAGCGAWLKHHAGSGDSAAGGAGSAPRFRDLSEFLDEIGLPDGLARVERRVAYQDACHLYHAQGIVDPPRRLLEAIPGLEIAPLRDAAVCCGSAGIYNLTEPEMAGALLQRKLATIEEAGPDEVISANPGCMIQIQTGLDRPGLDRRGSPIRVRHIAEVLAETCRDIPIASD